MHSNIPFSFD